MGRQKPKHSTDLWRGAKKVETCSLPLCCGAINQWRRPLPRRAGSSGSSCRWIHGRFGPTGTVIACFLRFCHVAHQEVQLFSSTFFFSKSGINDRSVRLLGFSPPSSSLEQPWNTSGPGHVVFSSWRGKLVDSKWRRQRGSMQAGRAVTSSLSH